jgi:hypothetical protein
MQTPKTILLHLDSSARTAERVKVARQLAEAFDAEVTGLPCTMSALMRYSHALEGAAEAVAITQSLDKECRDKAYATFTAAGAGSPRMHWAEPMSDAPWGFARRALYADLLVLPYAGTIDAIGRTVLIAWKETRESARAVAAALPWLTRAESVHAVGYGEAADASLRSLQGYLKAQGMSVTVHPGGPEEGNAGENPTQATDLPQCSRISDIARLRCVAG